MKKYPIEKRKIPNGRGKIPAVSAVSALTVAAALLLRIFYKGPYLRLYSSGIVFLSFAILFLFFRPAWKMGLTAGREKPKSLIGAALVLTAAALLALPLLLLGDSMGNIVSYTPYNPFAAENAPSFLSLLVTNALLPMLFYEIGCRKFAFSCFIDLFEKPFTKKEVVQPSSSAATIVSLLCGGLFALWQGEAMRLPAFMLLGTVFGIVAVKLSSLQTTFVFSLLLGVLLQVYDAYIAIFGFAASLPSVFQAVGMLLIFSAAAIPTWLVGMRLLSGKAYCKGKRMWLALLTAVILLISGCAIAGSNF